MPLTSSKSSTIEDQIRYRIRKTQKHQKLSKPVSETDPMYSIIPSNRSKSTISSLLMTHFSPNSPTHENPTEPICRKKSFTTFRGLGCRATSQVSVPTAIFRNSADWDSKKVKKKKLKSKKTRALNSNPTVVIADPFSGNNSSSSCVAVPDVWCGAGIGLTTDAAAVDCVVSRRPVSGRGRIDGEKVATRERSVRRMVSLEDDPFLDAETNLEMPRSGVDWFGSRHHRHSHHGFPEGLAEIVMLQNNLMGGRTDGLDRYRGLRLDVDNMSYEELLELGDRIGYVSTGLREDQIARCVRRTKPFFLNNLSDIRTELERKCSICQEEYEADDEMGKLGCGHFYHGHCIKQWLMRKNSCPVCKSAAMSNS